LRGQIIDQSDIATVTVNGQRVSLDKQGYFSYDIALQIGKNPVQIIAKDIFNNRARQSITLINKETKPPQILLPDVIAKQENATAYTLREQIIDDTDIATVTVNGQRVRLNKQGYNPPQILLPKNKIIVKDTTTYTLRGQITDDTGVASVSIDGQTLPLDKQGHFSYQVTLPIGRKKHIQISATDIENNSTEQKISIKHRCTTNDAKEQRLNPQDIATMHRYKIKVAFKGEDQSGSIIPKDINPSCLQQAESLDLSHLEMVYLPNWLAKFTQLRKLDISHNQLSPKELSAPLRNMRVLENLDISHNPLFKETCWFRWCSIKPTMPRIWQHIRGLRVLKLSHTGGDAKNYGDLSHIKNLYQLELNHNRLRNIGRLKL